MIGFIRMYHIANELRLENELSRNQYILERLGEHKSRFIKWASKQRFVYEADIEDEFREYHKKYIEQRLYNINVKLWKDISRSVMSRDGYVCSYCFNVGGILEVDHIVPISAGGDNNMENLTTSCRRCNRSKKDKSLLVYLATRRCDG